MYDSYYELFGLEPDCYEQIDYDALSYNDFVLCLKTSIVKGSAFPESVRKMVFGFRFR